MSRSQQNQTFNQGQQENQTYNTNAQNAFNQAQQGVSNYGSQLAKFSSSNPYTQGGEFQTAQNQQLADTANAGANQTAQAIQSAAVRTGSNPAGAIAASEEVAQQNQRTLGDQQAKANQERIGAEAGYNAKALAGYQTQQQMQDQLAQQQASAAQGALGTQEQAANTPSFGDMLGAGLINGFGQIGSAAIGKYCWLAAELWGGWTDPRTELMRLWLGRDFGRRWYGAPLVAAYARFGERLAAAIRVRPKLRRAVDWIFSAGLKRAQAWEQAQLIEFRESL